MSLVSNNLSTQESLRYLIADCLDISEFDIDPNIPLLRYGIDSMATVIIKTALAEEMGFNIPETLLFQNLTLAQLYQHLEKKPTNDLGEAENIPYKSNIEIMLKDGFLPIDIQPVENSEPHIEKTILLTGVTGELGSHLLQVLLKKTRAKIYCLIRANTDNELQLRITKALSNYGLICKDIKSRVIPIRGDISQHHLGLSTENYKLLSQDVDSIYHCAASVNWSLNYNDLRGTNVTAVEELLRLACIYKCKHFVFISSISACYAFGYSNKISETDDVSSLLGNVHLGYAQTKIISESLVNQASTRGLKTSIHRPSLILGNSKTGHSNPNDIISRLIKGCIQMGCAPDLNWKLDACPVDYVAEAIYLLSNTLSHDSHLLHPSPRQWQELVLWMNLYGYSVELIPYKDWITCLRNQAKSVKHPLYSLLPFFLNRISAADGLTLPEIYEEQNRNAVTAYSTSKAVSSFDLHCPEIDSDLLNHYFKNYIKSGFLPKVSNDSLCKKENISTILNDDYFSNLARKVFQQDYNSSIQVSQQNVLSGSSIIAELASWKTDKVSGLYRYKIDSATDQSFKEVFIKVKPSNSAVFDVATTIATLCSKELGKCFSEYKKQTGLLDCHKKELAIYQQTDERFLHHSPKLLGIVDEDENEKWILALETITRPVLSDTCAIKDGWSSLHIEASIRGLAELHSIWFSKETELLHSFEYCSALSIEEMEQAKPLWTSLAKHAEPYIAQWLVESIKPLQEKLINTIGDWWGESQTMQRTLIHHDFNPRNIMLTGTHEKPKLCAFDWELATLGLPQRDLVEFLCFVLPQSFDSNIVMKYMEIHRLELQKASGIVVSEAEWRRGILYSLNDMIINRIPMYLLAHRIKPQLFLPRVTKNWHNLYNIFVNLS